MKRPFRLTRSTDFKRVRRTGKSYAHPLVVLVTSPNDLLQTRVGFVVSRAVGGAVQRNLARRRLRACMEQQLACLCPGWDMLFVARKPLDQANFTQISAAVDSLLKRAGVLKVGA